MSNLKQEYQFYNDNRVKLLKKYKGKYLVISGKKVISAYNTEGEAYRGATKIMKLGTFLIHLCTEKEKEDVAIFHTRVSFA